MPHSITIPDELELKLEAEAERRGMAVSALIVAELEKAVSLHDVSDEDKRDTNAGEQILKLVQETFGSLPESERRKLPADYAKNYKHYLHGYPKIEE